MTRDWSHQNIVGALQARPSDDERADTVADALVELYGADAERAVCSIAASLRALREADNFDPTLYQDVHDAIWPDVSASSAFLTFAAEFTGQNMTYSEVEDEAVHDLIWSIIELSDEIEDEAGAVRMAFKIMADEEARNHKEG